MTRLIVNGDDFGMCEGVTLGILKAYREGILRSTTMMCNMPFARQAAQMAQDYPDLGLGIHFTLTVGKPVCDPKEVPTLVDENGYFHSQHWYLNNLQSSLDAINYEEVYKELRAQLELFTRLNGKFPDHIDSHHGTTSLPKVHDEAKKLVKEFDLAVRCTHDYIFSDYERPKFLNYFYDEHATIDYFLNDHDHICDMSLCEIMSHPGFVDHYLYTHSSYNIQRAKELDILCDPRVKEWVEKNNIELISFKDLKHIL